MDECTGNAIRLPGVAANADDTAASTLERAPRLAGDTVVVAPRNSIRSGRPKAASIRARAGTALSPAIGIPATETPAGIRLVGWDAGA